MTSHELGTAAPASGMETRTRVIAWRNLMNQWGSSLLFAVICIVTAGGLLLLALSWSAPVPDTFAFRGHAAILALAFGSVGWFLARRVPHNPIGWLFSVMGMAAAIQEVGQEYAAYSLVIHTDALPTTHLIGWIASWIASVALGSMMMVVLLFPNGRLPSKRWRAFTWLLLVVWAASIFASMIKPGPLRFAPFLDNPFGLDVWQVIITAVSPFIALSVVVTGLSILLRLRRARGIERQQLKWFTYVAALTCLVGIIYTTVYQTLAVTEPGLIKLIDILAIVIPSALPFAVALAILRYHLYDIDRVISRTLVYGTLSASVVVAYILIVGLFGALLNKDVNLAALFATGGLTALTFQPWRTRLQRLIDRPLATRGGSEGAGFELETIQVSASIPFANWLPWLVFGLSYALAALDVFLLVLNRAVVLPLVSRWTVALFTLPSSGVGLVLVRKRPQNAIGWLFLLFGLSAGASGFGTEYAVYAVLANPGSLPGAAVAGWIVSWLWVGLIGASAFLLLLFPTGRLPSTRWRPVAWATAVALGIAILAQMLKPGPLRSAPYLDNPIVVTGTGNLISAVYPFIYLAVISCQFAGAVCVMMRLRVARGIERQQLKYFAYASGLLIVTGILQSIPSNLGLVAPEWWNVFNFLLVAIIGLFPLTVGVAILRYRLWDIDILINRTLVYGALTASVVAFYILVVGALGTLSQTSGNLLLSLIATGLIAILFQPFRERLQRAANRLVYGERDEPVALMARLGKDLEVTMAPDAWLNTVARTIAEALKLPYVAIEMRASSTVLTTAAYGDASTPVQRIPLAYHGETLGHLVVAYRSSNESLSPADLKMLRIIAQQAGMAVHAAHLTADLQRSREQLVVAREEERRRIRRDLHDGLGPALASLAMQADDARESTRSDPDKTEAALEDMARKAQEALQDIRRLVYGLRPPALDELGLVGALKQAAASAPGGLHVDVDAPEPLPSLPAAVEVAAFRIVQETLNNVVRHAQAHCCMVSITIEDELRIEIDDDGVGLPPDVHAGVGLLSLHERAAELGGSCVVSSAKNGGTRILARLPLTHGRVRDG